MNSLHLQRKIAQIQREIANIDARLIDAIIEREELLTALSNLKRQRQEILEVPLLAEQGAAAVAWVEGFLGIE